MLKKTMIIFIVLLFAQMNMAQEDTSVKKWEANWESLQSRPYPDWFKDAKLGIFIHWGLYSVPAYGGKESYGEWFLRGLQTGHPLRVDFQKRVFGENFTYEDYAPLFKAELFNPDEWADIFKRSGARYIILVTKHHDGYCLWPSKQAPNWNSVDVGPKRDIVGELTKSVRDVGLKMGLYYSLTEWNNPLHRWYTDPNDQIKTYVDQYMLPQFKDLISTYKPSLLFTDGEWYNKASDFHAAEIISWYYNLVGSDAIVNNRWGGGSDIGFLTPEYSSGLKITDRPWSEVRGLGRSFGLNRNEDLEAYMTPEELIHFFTKAVANGGGITINVGPKADGQIPLLQQERLIQLGDWLKINGEAIYGSKTWIKQTEEKDVSLERIDPKVDFNWVRNTPGKPIVEDNFNVTWSGFIDVPKTGKYLFEAEVDDGMRLWIDDKLVIDKWKKAEESADGNVMTNADKTNEEGIIELSAAKKYPIKIEYFEGKQNASIHLYWSSKDQEKVIVPQTNLYSSIGQKIGDGLVGVYESKADYLCYTKKDNNVYAITLEWPGKELMLPIDIKNENVKISLLGKEGNLDYKINNGKIIIDLSNIYHNDLPCLYAWTFKIEGLGKVD